MEIFTAVVQALKTFFTGQAAFSTYVQVAAFVHSGVQSYKARMAAKRAGELLVQKYGTGGSIPVIYGTRRVAGTVVHMETTSGNRELFVVYAIAGHEIDSFVPLSLEIDTRSINDENIYRDGFTVCDGTRRYTKGDNEALTISDGGFFGSGAGEVANVLGGANPTVKPRMVFNLHKGEQNQTADPMLSGALNTWTNNHKLNGITYIAANFEYDTRGMFQGGVPNVTVVVNGKKLYDPRKDTAHGGTGSHDFDTTANDEFSNNPALCLLDYIKNDDYGKALPESAIDMATFKTAADECESEVQSISHTNITANVINSFF